MAIQDTILKARERGVGDARIVEEIIKANPEKANAFRQAQERGADPARILDEIISQNSQLRQTITGEKPADTGLGSFLERFKLSFGDKASKEKIKEIEEARGTRGKFDVGDIADIAGASLPFFGGLVGGFATSPTALSSGPIGPAAGIAIGTTAGESVKRAIGQALGVREKGAEAAKKEVTGIAGEGLLTFAGGKALGLASKPLAYGVSKLKSLFGRKTIEKILSTPEKDLGKLSEAERALYFSSKGRELTQGATQARQALQRETQQKILSIKDEVNRLNQEIGKASRDEVLRIRPKVIQAMGKQSQTYRDLVEKEILSVKDTPVSVSEIQQYIAKRFAQDPEMATNILSRLGVSEGQVGSKTIEALYKQSVALGQEIGTAARKGSRVFTADEKVTDDAISTLVEFLKTKGVDLTNARQFWAQYAPIRDQMIREIKPFVQTETLTSPFATRLVRIAKGKDPNNEIFLNELEKLVGTVGTEVKQLIQKLSATQKELVVTKIESEAKKQGIQLSTQQARQTLGQTKGIAAVQAEQRSKILKIIRMALYGLGAYKVGRFIFD